jgi:hypothetical protein
MSDEPDPGAMDGRAIAEKLYALSHEPNAPLAPQFWLWIGVACARMLEYQRALEKLGQLPQPPAGKAP